MDKEQEFAFGSVCAQLGLDKSSEVSAVINRITSLMDAENKIKDVQSQLDALKIEKAGVDAQLVNAKKELADANVKLKSYQDAEKAQRDAEVAKFIDDAIADGKITAESKETWVAMAATNFEVVKATLNSIEKRDKITAKIANDKANVNDAASAMTEAEKKMAEAVDSVVGKDFEFKTLD
jgi:chromosome segregation ATPase